MACTKRHVVGSAFLLAQCLMCLAAVALAHAASDVVEAPAMSPLRGIAYGALPCTEQFCGGLHPPEDMLLNGYAKQWGPEGRDDLAIMADLGANAVRLYHSLGLDGNESHVGFLNHAQQVGLDVMPGFHTESANQPYHCPEYDCFETWKQATLKGFTQGFAQAGAWHPAVATLILLNEPDFFEFSPKCQPSGAWCRVKAALSALDGVLMAEKEAGISAGRVRLTVTWSFGMMTSIDGSVTGPGVFGFQDMVAGVADPQIAYYTPRSTHEALEQAFRTRWTHGLNTQAPWSFVNAMVSKEYARFSPAPWFIGEYGANGQPADVIQADLEAMHKSASESSGFLGAAVFQFQTAHWKGGSEMNFGLFRLGDQELGSTDEICAGSYCHTYPVHCLSTRLDWLPGTLADRAQAVASAWNGTVASGKGLCSIASPSVAGESGPRRLRGSHDLFA